jgi:TnpA family transposase
LLGFDLLPRIKRVNKTRLYRPSAGEPGAWPRLEPALTRPIRWDLVASQYDQMIKYATAIRTGTASTEAILRRFTKANAVHPAYQAMAEVRRPSGPSSWPATYVTGTCNGRSMKASTSWSPGTGPTR